MKTVAGTMAFISGGASGIGLGMARALAAQGARIAVCDVRADHLAQAAQVAADEGWADRFRALQLDVRDRDAFAAALDEAEAALGPLQILVNNAGIGIQGPVDEATYADWDWAIGVNLMGVVNGLVSGLPRIKAHGLGGHVVNTASQGAIMQARATRGVYAPTKAAVISMTEHLKLELDAKGSSMGGSSMGGGAIGATVVCPGPVRTNIEETEQHRPAEFQVDTPFRHRDETPPPGALPPTAPGFWLDPLTVGEMTVDAILTGKLYVITHPAFIGSVKARHAGIEAAMAEDYLPR
ncbi:NAD(P)-dependent dehydrogenase (short-subunit alcohol dehydrogenase family) [Sphingobium sp. B1D7B]|uniref:SDR family NAD(P)-dependent oxidoreductase n=1 Tax=unclassified Sphingobium TaxID=2611147 RepID=UPI002223F47C|nr:MULTISPECIES: SDR family NAD(P)-dependent oxidoreductase [unclassified Sphingobium]MCW2390318.1 NAD(P)-dependent dehydrogenase (short-subunit alcohol dehydrogenase family) [Sphingobium sp. B11D3A]MCW2405459.1 NAD(P)-dependent dehydrogenase (short-subunit alcohol dehydrogenase family) [Sphingobium sp. B1D7B]